MLKHSEYNKREKAINLLNIVWSGCGFKWPKDIPSWFMHLMRKEFRITAVCQEIFTHDEKIQSFGNEW